MAFLSRFLPHVLISFCNFPRFKCYYWHFCFVSARIYAAVAGWLLPAAPLPYNFISIFLNIASAVSQSVVIFLFYLFSFILFFFQHKEKVATFIFLLGLQHSPGSYCFYMQAVCMYLCMCVCVQHSSAVPFCSPVRRSLAKRGIEIELDFSD